MNHAFSILIIFTCIINLCSAGYNKPLSDKRFYTQALWNMDSEINGIILDEDNQNPSRNNELQLFNGASLIISKPGYGRALNFDGIDDYAAAVYPSWQHRSGVLIELWLWIDSTNDQISYIISCDNAFQLFFDKNNSKLGFRVWNTQQCGSDVKKKIELNCWQHIRAEFDEGTLSLDIKGEIKREKAKYNKMASSRSNICLGRSSSNKEAGYFKGKIDDLRITFPKIALKSERGKDIVECAVIDNIDNIETAKPICITNWCVAALWLGSKNYNVTPADIELANSRLININNPALFTQIHRTMPEDYDDDKVELYWSLSNLIRIVNDPVIFNRTNNDARKAIQNILTDFVMERDNLTHANISESVIWSFYNSVNHDWLSESTFLLTAQYFKNAGLNIIYKDGHTVDQHYNSWVLHFKEKFKQMAARGLDPEISTPGYFSLTFTSLFNIRDLCEDKELANQAEKYINLYLADAAVESYHGVRGGSRLRSYKSPFSPHSYNPDNDSFGFWSHLFANDPVTYNGRSVHRTLLGAAMSHYTLPKVVYNLMTDTNKNFAHTSCRPAKGSFAVSHMRAIHTFDFPSDLRRYTYGNPKFILGSFAIDDQKPEQYNYTQNQWMGLITSSWRYSRIYFQTDGPANNKHRGYRDLNAIQNNGAMLIKRQEAADRTSPLFCWMSDDFRKNQVGPNVSTNYWIFSKNYSSDVYIAVKAVDAASSSFYKIDTSLEPNCVGNPLKITLSDSNTIVAFEAVESKHYANFTAFQDAIKNGTFRRNGLTEVEYVTLDGNNLKMYTDGNLSKLNNETYKLNINKTYDGKYLYNNVYADPIVYIEDNHGAALKLDFNYKSPN